MMEREERSSAGDERDLAMADEEGARTAEEVRPTTADIASGGETEAGAEESPPEEDVHETDRDRPEAEERSPLLADDASSDVRSRWEQIQGSFVDEPRRAVEEADALVAELMQQLADSFAQERRGLEAQWDRGDQVSTEDLRIALQRYRSFFDRLLSA
jgi:hypothetical protein